MSGNSPADDRRLRVLMLSPEPPYPPTHGGLRLRLFHLLGYLGQRHEITLLTLLETPQDRDFLPALSTYCRRVMGFNRLDPAIKPGWRDRLRAPAFHQFYRSEVAAAIRTELQTTSYDLVHVDGGMSVYTHLLNGSAKLLSCNDSSTLAWENQLAVTTTPGNRLRLHRNLFLTRAFERRVFPQYDVCVMVAARDANVNREFRRDADIQVVPNGVDLAEFVPGDPSVENPLAAVFTGTMDYEPNVNGVGWFVHDVWPAIRRGHPTASFEIVGRSPVAAVSSLARTPGVSVTGFVPAISPYLHRASVYVCPLRTGSGMKNKVLEAMASGKAIVSTTEGVSGIDGRPGNEYLVADRPEEFAANVLNLFGNPGLRQRLGRAARQWVEKNFLWERAGQSFDQIYRRIASSRRPD